jgi:hypothetical protein
MPWNPAAWRFARILHASALGADSRCTLAFPQLAKLAITEACKVWLQQLALIPLHTNSRLRLFMGGYPFSFLSCLDCGS